MASHRRIVILILLCLGLVATRSAYAFRCSGGLISTGDSKLILLKKCGEPTWIDRWAERIVVQPDTDFEHSITRINERWIYNRGPTDFIRIITLRDGRVANIETGGRGFTVIPGSQRCDFNSISLGTSTAVVRAKCGQPDSLEQHYETVTEPIAGGRRQVSVSVDEWTFNLGPSQFMRILTFRNGELVNISTGERGFQ